MISLISFFGNKKHSPLFYYIHSRLLVGERSGQEEYEHESLVLTSIPLQSNTRLEGISAFYMDGINSVLCALALNGRSEVNFQKKHFYKFIFKLQCEFGKSGIIFTSIWYTALKISLFEKKIDRNLPTFCPILVFLILVQKLRD